MTDAAPAPAPVITAEIAARETGRHPNIIGHRERMAERIEAHAPDEMRNNCVMRDWWSERVAGWDIKRQRLVSVGYAG